MVYFNSSINKFFIVLCFLLPFESICSPLDSLSSALKRAKTNKEKFNLTLQLSTEYMTKDFNLSLEYGQRAVFLSKVLDNPEDKIKAYKQLGTVFFSAGMIDKAIPWILKTKEVALQSKNDAEILNANLNLGAMSLGLEDYKKALDVFLEGDSLIRPTYKKLGKKVPAQDLTVLYTNIGLCNMMLGEMQDGYLYLDKATEVLNENKDLSESLNSKILQIWAIGLTKEKKAHEAISKINEAKIILERLGDELQLIGLQSFLAQAYEVKGDYETAIDFSRKGYQGGLKMNNLYMKRQFSEALYKLFENTNNADSSFKYLKLLNVYKEESKTANAKEELLKQELLKEFNERESELRKEEVAKKNTDRYLLASIGFVSVFLLGLIIYNGKKYSREQIDRVKLKLEKERLELEKETLQNKLDNKNSIIDDLTYRLTKNGLKDNLQQENELLLNSSIHNEDEIDFKPNSSQQAQVLKDFELRFLQTHTDFYVNLLELCPDLTMNERRLCAFLKMDMSTKEISMVTGQSIRSINMARFRLRKKMNINNSETSLFDLLAKI